MNKLYNNKGYTLLFASLTAALVLGVAVFILSVSRKQFLLASTARNSMYSIYAADSGVECVSLRNTDAKGDGSFDTDISTTTIANHFPLNCNGQVVSMKPLSTPGHDSLKNDADLFQARGYLSTGGYPDATCAEITISIGVANNGSISNSIDHKKIFDVRGYNLCTVTGDSLKPNFTSPNTVERALRLIYSSAW